MHRIQYSSVIHAYPIPPTHNSFIVEDFSSLPALLHLSNHVFFFGCCALNNLGLFELPVTYRTLNRNVLLNPIFFAFKKTIPCKIFNIFQIRPRAII